MPDMRERLEDLIDETYVTVESFDAAKAAAAVMTEVTPEIEGLCRQIERVRALHPPMQRGGLTICAHCSGWDGRRCRGLLRPHPCPTLDALEQPTTGASDGH